MEGQTSIAPVTHALSERKTAPTVSGGVSRCGGKAPLNISLLRPKK